MTKQRPAILLALLATFSGFLIVAYVYLYQFSSLPVEQNNLFLNLISLIAPLLSAIFANSVFLRYRLSDKPRSTWLYMMIFVILWTIAEFIWVACLIFTEDVPMPSLADAFWLTGFIFLTIALRKQEQLITRRLIPLTIVALLWFGVAALSFIFLWGTGSPLTLGNYLEYFYAVADIAAGIVAVKLFWAFRGGLLARPWIGLFVLGVSDAIYAWLIATDMYAMAQDSGNLISLIADTTYMAAYLFLAVGFYALYLVIKHGPESFAANRAE